MKKIFVFVAIALVASSCKKNEMRTRSYALTAFNNSGMSGQLIFKERSDDQTTVRLEASGLLPNTIYLSHLHSGNLDSLTGTLINFANLQTATNDVVREEIWALSYEEAIESNSCFTMHDPNNFANNYSSYFLAGNTGDNAP